MILAVEFIFVVIIHNVLMSSSNTFVKFFFRIESCFANAFHGLNPLICISAFNLGYLHRYLLPVAQDGWGISIWLYVEISLCRHKISSKNIKIKCKNCLILRNPTWRQSFRGYCPAISSDIR